MNISIQSWCAWQPEVGGGASCSTFENGKLDTVVLEKPVLPGIPPMQKRRLSSLARIVFHVLDHCAGGHSSEPVVFSSYMGEIKRTQGILDTMAAGEAVSPAAFSLSVHNAISGLWSLVRDNKAPMVALAPTVGSPVAALVEAVGMLAEGNYCGVTVVYYEEDYPAFYAPFLTGPVAPYALALRLVASDDHSDAKAASATADFELRRLSDRASSAAWTSCLSLVDVLTGKQDSLLIAEPQCQWSLERRR